MTHITRLSGLVLLLGTGASALALGAGAASASTTPPALSITTSPATVLVASQQHAYSENVVVYNSGSAAAMVHPSIMNLAVDKAGNASGSTPPSWAHLTSLSGLQLGKSIELQPGSRLTVKFSLDAPASVKGTQDIAAVFSATAVKPSASTVRMGPEVASRIVLRLAGSNITAAPARPAHHIAAPKSNSSSVPFVAGGAVVLLALLAGIILWLRRRHANQV